MYEIEFIRHDCKRVLLPPQQRVRDQGSTLSKDSTITCPSFQSQSVLDIGSRIDPNAAKGRQKEARANKESRATIDRSEILIADVPSPGQNISLR